MLTPAVAQAVVVDDTYGTRSFVLPKAKDAYFNRITRFWQNFVVLGKKLENPAYVDLFFKSGGQLQRNFDMYRTTIYEDFKDAGFNMAKAFREKPSVETYRIPNVILYMEFLTDLDQLKLACGTPFASSFYAKASESLDKYLAGIEFVKPEYKWN